MKKLGKNKGQENSSNKKTTVNSNSIDASMLVGLLHDIGHYDNMMEIDEESRSNTQAEISDNTYQDITKNIVEITKTNLEKQECNKNKLRKPLQIFIIAILSVQLLILAIMLFGNNFFNLDPDVIKTYILSVFAETLLGLTIMIRFAFSNKQEVELISILNSVVSNFKIFGENNDSSAVNVKK